MTAQAANFSRKRQGIEALLALTMAIPVAATARIFQGSMVAVNTAGLAVVASADGTLRVFGVCEVEADNTSGAASAINVTARRGDWYLANSAGTGAVTDADIGRPCYVVDDSTVSRISALGVRPVAGIVRGVDGNGVLVGVGITDSDADEDFLAIAAADLSARQHHLVDITAAGEVDLASTGTRVCGVLRNAPVAAAVAIVKPLGCGRAVRVIAGAAITRGDTIASMANGRAKTAVLGTAAAAGNPVAGSHTVGVALSAAAVDGDPITALLVPIGVAPTTAA